MKDRIAKLNIKKWLPIILLVFILVLIIGAFTFLRPQEKPLKKTSTGPQQEFKIEDVKGVTNIKRFSDTVKNLALNKTNKSSSSISRPKPTPVPLPYPRISINYVMRRTSSIRNEIADNNNTFVIVTLDIKNYGYQYFDAHPTKFRLVYSGAQLEPTVTISTGNVLDEVLSNSSRTKGDLVFLLDKKKASSGALKIAYVDSGYTILYNQDGRRRRW